MKICCEHGLKSCTVPGDMVEKYCSNKSLKLDTTQCQSSKSRVVS